MTTPVAPGTSCWSSVRGLAARFTRLDTCGKPVVGASSTIVTDGFVTVSYAPQYTEGTETTVTNAAGKTCIYDKGNDTLTRFDTTVTLCAVNPALGAMMTGQELVLDYAGKAVGFRISEDIATTGVALELWSDVISDVECGSGGQQWGYFLAPRIVGIRLNGDVEISNGALSLQFQGRTKRNAWGTGPYSVVGTGATGATPGKLLTPMAAKQHLHAQVTTVAPPVVPDDCGPVALAA